MQQIPYATSLASSIDKLRDTANDLGSEDTFFKIWNFLPNNNGSLNIQFNWLTLFIIEMPHYAVITYGKTYLSHMSRLNTLL